MEMEPVIDQSVPPVLQCLPTAKEKKYDRQLRLWAASGQAALEQAHVLLINSGSGVTGIELLKNLVLPGMGNFTIHDEAIVDEADLGVNFFVTHEDVGKSRAELTCRSLLELNPDVTGHAINQPVSAWINTADVLASYTLIILAHPQPEQVKQFVHQHYLKTDVPIIHFHSVGFYSHFSTLLPKAFPMVDTHPEPTATTDLRLLSPWPELVEFCRAKTSNIDQLSAYERGHIPYILLLLHHLELYRSDHEGKYPVSHKEKIAFREQLTSISNDYIRESTKHEETEDLENYQQAISAVLKTVIPVSPPSSILSILSSPESQPQNLDSSTSSFWIICNALSQFINLYHQLPLSGGIPDMKATSEDYIVLKGIYKTKARKDCDDIERYVRDIETNIPHYNHDRKVRREEIDQFCKLASHVKVIRGSDLSLKLTFDANSWTKDAGKTLVGALPNRDVGVDSSVLIYVAFLAWDGFCASHNRIPGDNDETVNADTQELITLAEKVLGEATTVTGGQVDEISESVKTELRDVCAEMTRAGGGELHNIASLTGGMIAQEVIKVITKQYVPADNTCVFDGVGSRSEVYKM